MARRERRMGGSGAGDAGWYVGEGADVNYRLLGRTGLRVSVIGVGTNQLRRVPERQAVETLGRAFDLGVNLVNLEPDYEGAERLVRIALRERRSRHPILLSAQAGGDVPDFERAFEELCRHFDQNGIDLFGITSITEAELYGARVWGAGGLVEFLVRRKEEGRIRAIFASAHGTPAQLRDLIERDVFDALLLAYNPIGFHIHTFRAETVYDFEQPPPGLRGRYQGEDLATTGGEILPLARAKGVGVMLMKPLAGGLLVRGKAFGSHPWRPDLPPFPVAADVLRLLLSDEAVTCVVPAWPRWRRSRRTSGRARGTCP